MCKKNDYIVRIISREELFKHVLPLKKEPDSTFHLRSAISYRESFDENNADPDEMQCKGNGFHANCSNNYLVSCWSYLGNNDNPEKFFTNRKERNEVAIISSIGKMEAFLRNTIYDEYEQKGIFAELNHKKVTYYKEGSLKFPALPEQQSDFIMNRLFSKRDRWEKEEEYRFAIRETSLENSLHSLTFYAEPADYIEGIWVNKTAAERDIIAALTANNLEVAIFKNSSLMI
jgi:hypothetical protein